MPRSLMHYDSYERHRVVRLLLAKSFDGVVLDAGGATGLLGSFLGGVKVIALNVDNTGDIQYSGSTFPFATRAFDAVASLDALEHLPKGLRKGFVSECVRVARGSVVIAAPFGTKEHSEYEVRLDRLYHEVHGAFNRWLHEHVVHGLPTESEVAQLRHLVEQEGFSVRVLYAGDYRWQCRNLERSLLVGRRIRGLRKLGWVIDRLASLAVWRRVTLSTSPYDVANRFYLFGQKM